MSSCSASPPWRAYDAFLQTHLVSDPLVVLTDTNVVIRPLKMSFAQPVEATAA